MKSTFFLCHYLVLLNSVYLQTGLFIIAIMPIDPILSIWASLAAAQACSEEAVSALKNQEHLALRCMTH